MAGQVNGKSPWRRLLNNFEFILMFGKKQKAFSLIELLVVISIVAVLMAILVPVLATARSLA